MSTTQHLVGDGIHVLPHLVGDDLPLDVDAGGVVMVTLQELTQSLQMSGLAEARVEVVLSLVVEVEDAVCEVEVVELLREFDDMLLAIGVDNHLDVVGFRAFGLLT